MKNWFYRHLGFWLAYCLEATLLEYSWVLNLNLHYKPAEFVVMAITFTLVGLPVKMLLTYYILYGVIDTAFKKGTPSTEIVLKIAAGFLVTLFLYRLCGNYYVLPRVDKHAVINFAEIFNLSKILGGTGDIGFVAGAAATIKLFRMQMINLKRERNLTKEKLETELKFLKNQINPHFLFNTLNNIYVLARKKSDKAPEVVLKLSKLLRFMLYESGKGQIPLSDEIRILEDYVQLEKIRYTNRLHINFNQEIDDMTQPIAPLILLPFIENAFKHGASETIADTYIDIGINLKDGILAYEVKNSQDCHEACEIKENIGLSNVRRQLELMYRHFNLEVENIKESFKIKLTINLNKSEAL